MLPDNPLRGEASVEIGGTAYRLTFDVSAAILTQKATGLKLEPFVTKLLKEPDDLEILSVALWSCLSKEHKMTLAEAEELVSQAGPTKTYAALMEVFGYSFGPKEDGDETDPPKPGETPGTG